MTKKILFFSCELYLLVNFKNIELAALSLGAKSGSAVPILLKLSSTKTVRHEESRAWAVTNENPLLWVFPWPPPVAQRPTSHPPNNGFNGCI